MVKNTLGINEALILASLGRADGQTIADIAKHVEPHREIYDGSIYVALQRMAERGYVTSSKARVTSADGRRRDIGVYQITAEGQRAIDQWANEAAGVTRLRLGVRPA